MRKLFLFLMPCLLFLPSGAPVRADTHPPSASSGQIRFYIDTAGFRATGGLTHQEVYFLLPGDQLSFRPEAGAGYTATFTVEWCVQDAKGDTLHHRRLMKRTQVDSAGQGPAQAGTSAVLDLFSVTLRPGDHRLTVTVQDTLSGKKGISQTGLPVAAFDQEHLAVSDLQIGSSIEDADGQGKFVKNRKRVIPNVIRSVSSDRPTLYAYFEIYNLQPAAPDAGAFSLFYAILDSSDAEVKRYPVRRIPKPGASCAKAEALDLSDLPPGDYALRVTVEDHQNARRAQREQGFRLLPVQGPSPLLSVDEEALRRYYDGIKHLATQKELDTYRSLDPEGKRRFILDFWKRRDPTPGTPANEFALEHFQRMSYADAHLREGRTKGSDTDRGRVYILYGPPADVERHTTPLQSKSYEVWTYERGGNYEFVFLDRRGAGAYELVHSTMPGEKYDPMWQSER
jgi:GWxTD domain-containing protein